MPVTPNVPPIVASLVTLKPVPLPLLKVNVSAISAVLFTSRVPATVVLPVASATVNLSVSTAIPPFAFNKSLKVLFVNV